MPQSCRVTPIICLVCQHIRGNPPTWFPWKLVLCLREVFAKKSFVNFWQGSIIMRMLVFEDKALGSKVQSWQNVAADCNMAAYHGPHPQVAAVVCGRPHMWLPELQTQNTCYYGALEDSTYARAITRGYIAGTVITLFCRNKVWPWKDKRAHAAAL